MSLKNFAVFILTNSRPNRVITKTTLQKCGYTGKIYLILDDQDRTIDEYQNLNKDCGFFIFNKRTAIENTDSAENKKNPRAVVYARNECHRIAKELGLESFLVLDDDYDTFMFTTDNLGLFGRKTIKKIDKIFEIFIEFLKNTTATTIAFAQGGDFIGGKGSYYGETSTLTRKAMNSFFCLTERPFKFYGLINEDVNAYVLDGSRGRLFFTSTDIQLNQQATQKSSGGLTTIYLEQGTYVKSFYSVMYHPSSVRIALMGRNDKRLHHSIEKDFTYPKILRAR